MIAEEYIKGVPASDEELRRVFVQDKYPLVNAGLRGVTKGLAGAATALTGATELVGAVGFTSSGIGAGTYAAQLMSWSAIANGGAVPAGGLVATLQSAGVVGFGAGVCSGVGAAFATGAAGYEVYAHLAAEKELLQLLKGAKIARHCTVASLGKPDEIKGGDLAALCAYLKEHNDVGAIAVVDGTVLVYHISADAISLAGGQMDSNVVLLAGN